MRPLHSCNYLEGVNNPIKRIINYAKGGGIGPPPKIHRIIRQPNEQEILRANRARLYHLTCQVRENERH